MILRTKQSAALWLAAVVLGGWSAQAEAAEAFTYRFLDEPAEGEYNLFCAVTCQAGGQQAGELRIAFDASDTGELSYARFAEAKVALYREAGGQAQRSGDAQSFRPAGDFEVTVQRRADRVRVIAAGEVLLNVPWDAPLGGKVGIGSSGSGLTPGEPLLQPIARPYFGDDFTREEGEMASWRAGGGVWRNTMVQAPGADPQLSANPFSLHGQAEGDALAMAGYWFWDTYHVSASVKPTGAGFVGLCGYVQDEANYIALRWCDGAEDEPDAKELVLVRDGAEEVLAKAPGGFVPGEWYRLELRLAPGHVEASIDREPVLAADTSAFGQGGVGLWVRDGEAVFDDALVMAPDAWDARLPDINPVFAADGVMAAQEVFLPRGFWRPGANGAFWHWGEFFDDATAVVPLDALQGQALNVLLRSDGADPAVGYRVALSVENTTVTTDVARNGASVQAGVEPLQGGAPLLITVRGDTLSVSQGSRELLSYTDSAPLAGRQVALLGAPASALDLVSVISDHFWDYAFDSGPTDWFAGEGLWEVTTRWPCSPGWTFFGGTRSENPILWTKHSYSGDIVLEFFANVQMDLPPPPGYSHPSDVNATICGDGSSPGSGYSFVLAGWNNTKSAILRKGEIVAETPNVIFVNPTSSNAAFHRHWFRVRAEKVGGHLRFWVDGQPILEYTDPDPLSGGRVALWSFHNGLMVGRARVWYADEQPGGVGRTPGLRPNELEPAPRTNAPEVFNDFEADVGEWQTVATAPGAYLELDDSSAAAGKQSLKITNELCGGPFAVYAVTTPFRIADWSALSFDYRLMPDVKLNLYLYINGHWHALKFTAEQFPWDGVPVMGEIADVQADGEWHHAQFDLLAPLQQMYPQFKSFVAKYVALSAPQESYARCGIGGNGRGAHYWVDNFRIGPAQ